LFSRIVLCVYTRYFNPFTVQNPLHIFVICFYWSSVACIT
uniref:Very-long-chain 3-oxoacyl-CoA synthase n=1 Tax=Brugia timori TaxID=42155 RepID=A0A0R3R7J9_9BILA